MGLKSFSLRVFKCGVLSLNFYASLRYLACSTLDVVHCLGGYVVKPGFNCGVLSLNLYKPKESFLQNSAYMEFKLTVHCLRVYTV